MPEEAFVCHMEVERNVGLKDVTKANKQEAYVASMVAVHAAKWKVVIK
jgi:hypothetical protein